MRYFIPQSRMMVQCYHPCILSVSFEGSLWVSERPAIKLIKDWLDWFVLGRGRQGRDA